MKKGQLKAVMLAVLSAALYSISSPISKILLNYISPNIMAALLYLGAGIGMAFLALINKNVQKFKMQEHLTKKDLPYAIGIVVIDIAAAVFRVV